MADTRTVDVGGRSYLLARLNIKALRAVTEGLDALKDNSVPFEAVDLMVEAVFQSMSRADPAISKDAVESMLDGESVPRVFREVLLFSGLVPVKDPKPGEAKSP